MTKKIITAVGILSAILFLCFVINYRSNEKWISRYEKGKYTKNKMIFTGLVEPYIGPYNNGDMYYMTNDYESAIQQYEIALKNHPPKYKECKIRINLALARLAMIDFENIKQETRQKVIDELYDILDILTEDGCACIQEGEVGHDEDAQQLADDILKKIDELKKQQESSSSSSNSQNSDPNQEQQPQQPQEEKDPLQEQFEQMQEEANNERGQSLGDSEYDSEWNYYDGPTW